MREFGNGKDDDMKATSALKRHSADSDTLRSFNALSAPQSHMQTSISSLNSVDNASMEEISVPDAPRLDPLPENDVLRVQVVLPSRLMDILGDAAGALGDEIEMDLTQSPTPSPSVPTSRRGSIAAFQRRDSRAATPVSAEAVASLPRIMSKTTIIHSSDESPQETFERLIRGIKDGSMEKSEIEDQLFNTLVGGQFDLETRYIIEDSSNIERMLTLLTHADETLQAEIWSVFLAIVRKSKRNLEACSRISLISKILDILPEKDGMLSDLLVQLLGVLTNYSITVKETKQFLRSLQAVNHAWSSNRHITMKVAEQVIDMAKFLLRCSSGGPLIKQLFEHIMFNPKLWINSEPSVQVHLYNYLATDFLGNTNFHHIIRQVATFGEMCHALKFYYWVTLPKTPSAYQGLYSGFPEPIDPAESDKQLEPGRDPRAGDPSTYEFCGHCS
ncbi:hypothetical protein TELCIR_05031 [Teladorsagia circumcincta]|uniref:Uncharacterized protein n=1 Tax=Teladorsagia circumcincta TaxID=45464 RepID=A0A2G9UU16_TELCI|nr:hypothetical protein TELCIR_05031 [Teladorsagia circumcincta]